MRVYHGSDTFISRQKRINILYTIIYKINLGQKFTNY
jgi:hypothetical protein